MKFLKAGRAGIVFAFIIVGCATANKSSGPTAQWMNNMHRLSAAHLRLMPMVADQRRFSDPEYKARIVSDLKELAQTASEIEKDRSKPYMDPVIAFTASELAGNTRHALSAFQMGDTNWARMSLNRTSSYCISCHTRSDRGTSDFTAPWTADLKPLNSIQTLEYELANRRYSTALALAFKIAADDGLATKDPRAWLLVLEKTLGMVVRVKHDPAQAGRLVKAIATNPGAPYYIRSDAQIWLKDIGVWSKAKGTQAVTLKQVKALIGHDPAVTPLNSGSLIRSLRASVMLHELIERKRIKDYAEVLFYSGVVADGLRDLNMGFLDQYYYESCIENEPHSFLAERCYARLETSVRAANPFWEFDRDADLMISAKLSNLRKLAEVKDFEDDTGWRKRQVLDEVQPNGMDKE